MRLFVAVDLPVTIRSRLKNIQQLMKEMSSGIRWGKVGGIHCTLKFIGEVDENRADKIENALCAVDVPPPFRLHVRGLGVFPGWSNPRVIWTGIDPLPPELIGLQRSIEKVLKPLGFPPEKRPFKPHLTLGRVKQKDKLQRLIEYIRTERDSIDLGPFDVHRFTLFQSILRPEGAEYRSIRDYSLKGDYV